MVTRRQWLRFGVVGAGSVLIGCDGKSEPFVGIGPGNAALPCVDELPAVANEVADPVAVFEVDSDSALVWAHAPQAEGARLELVELSDSAGCESMFTDSFDVADVGWLLVEGLRPSTTYAYRVEFSHGSSPWGTLRTAPAPDEDAPVHFVYSADIHTDPQWQTDVMAHMAASAAQFYVNLGDWPYADAEPAARALDEYRGKHRDARAPASVRGLLRRFPVYAMYDDHDVRCNWDGKWRGLEPERIAAGTAAWDEWFPLRQATRYRSVRQGRHAELFILDTRLFRSANADEDGPDKTLLGAEQLEWLRASLLASDATFKLIVSSVPLSYATGNDNWSAFATERDALLEFIRANDLAVAFLSADRHYFAALHHASGMREFHAGPLAAGPGNPPTAGEDVLHVYNAINYGEVIIAGGATPTLIVACRDARGEERYREVLTADDLRLG